jgi:hypothetical protein
MAKTFTISTNTAETLKADPKGQAQAVFTVTNATSRPVRVMATAKPLGDTKREWLSIAGETDRDLAGSTTSQFTVNFKAPGAPGGKYPFRLDVASAVNPDEDFTEGQTINVEIPSLPPPPPKKPFPIWIVIVIVAAVLLIGGVILVLVLRSRGSNGPEPEETPTPVESPTETPTATPTQTPTQTPTATPAQTPTPGESAAVLEKRCFDLVQGQIAWNYQGSKSWSAINIENLCRGTTQPSEPPRCFQRVMHGGIKSGAPPVLSIERNVDRPGRDFSAFFLPQANDQLCRDACANNPSCTAYTYVNPGVQGPQARCWLKSGTPPNGAANGCCTSGVKTDRSTQWEWQNASNLCKGTNDADKIISCYQASLAGGASMQDAIAACNAK